MAVKIAVFPPGEFDRPPIYTILFVVAASGCEMYNKLEVTFEGDHVRVIADGDKDYHYMEKLWRDVTAQCELNNCYNVLGIAKTTTPVEAVEGYELPALFQELNVDQRYRIAWVELNEDAQDMLSFVQTVLANRGLPGLLFDTEEEAREWLLGS